MDGIKFMKSEGSPLSTIKIDSNLRLQKWLSIQQKLPKSLLGRTSFKSNARGSSEASYLIVRTAGLPAKEQLDLLFELMQNLKLLDADEKIA